MSRPRLRLEAGFGADFVVFGQFWGSQWEPFWYRLLSKTGSEKRCAKINAFREFGVVLLRVTVAALRGPAGGGGILTEFPCGLRKWSDTPQPVKDWRGGSKSAARKAATVPFLCLFPNFWCL